MENPAVVNDNNTVSEKPIAKTRNTCLYFFEAIACCLIVFIHCVFPGNFGIAVDALARFGVPLFFVISGFFLYEKDISKETVRRKLRKRAIRLSILLFFSFAIYFTLGLLTACFGKNGVGLSEYLKSTFHWKRIILLLVCNNPLSNVVNWFMVALLFSYLIIYIFPNLFLKNDIVLYIVSGLTLFWIIFKIIVIATNAELFGIKLSTAELYRSWYANGLLFICFGILLKKKEMTLLRIPSKVAILILCISLVTTVAEQFLLKYYLGKGVSYSFGNIGSVFVMVALSVKYPDLFSKSKLLNAKGNWTTFVYIFHPAVIICLSIALSKLNISGTIIDWIKPLVVLALTLGIAIAFNSLIELIKSKRNVTKQLDKPTNEG